jgi:hypothetical protein
MNMNSFTILSSLVPGKYSGTPTNALNFVLRKRFNIMSWTIELAIQYKLKAYIIVKGVLIFTAGKVIQMGTEIKGRM